MPLMRPVVIVMLFVLVGCGERPVVEVPTTHPANPGAMEAPASAPSRTLDLTTVPAPTAASTPMQGNPHAGEGHDHEHMHHEPVSKEGQQQAEPAGSGAGPAPKTPAETEEHGSGHHAESAPPTSPKAGDDHPKDAGSKVQYTCPMHAEVIKDEPSRCPICNMKLVIKKIGDHP